MNQFTAEAQEVAEETQRFKHFLLSLCDSSVASAPLR